MTEMRKKRGWKYWLMIAVILAVLLPAVMIVGLLFTLSSGVIDSRIRAEIAQQIAKRLNTNAELGQFHFDPWRLRVILADLTIHGREPEGTPAFLHIARLEVGIRVDSLWGRKFSVGDVELVRPAIHVRVEPSGKTNVPLLPSTTPGKPIRERLFEVVVRRLRLDDGELLFNDVRVPLVAQGQRMDLAVDYSDTQGRRTYLGQFRWDQMELAARRYLPFASDIAVRFALEPDSLSVTQLSWTAPHTSLDAQFSLASFVHPSWTFRYRGRLDFQDIRTLLRKPTTPDGRVEFNGDGHFADGKLALTGAYAAEQIAMHFQWFHTAGITTRGTYRSDTDTFISPDFSAHALGGIINGNVQLELRTLQFHVNAHAQGMDLATIMGAVNNASFPVSPLHWAGNVEVQSANTWVADFKKMDSSGVSVWTPPAAVRPGQIPVTSRFNYHYSMVANNVALQSGLLTTPTSRLQFNGGLSSLHSDLQATFDSQDLTTWDDFINRLRGADAPPEVISGQAHWQGSMSGPLAGPAFAGHVKGINARYGRLYWDEVEGDMTYSPDAFTMAHSVARLGRSSAQFDAALELDNWSFAPESPWSFDATLVRTDSDGLQTLLGVSYPVHGVISGDFHGTGTRASPAMNGLFDIIDPEAWGWKFDRARGQINLGHGEVRISNAELRLPPPPVPNGAQTSSPPGVVTGNFLYRTDEQSVAFDLTGAVLPLAGIGHIQTPRLPVGGQLTFHLTGEGPVLAPKLQGSLRLVDLRLGSEVVGSFNGNVESDGSHLALQVDSAMSTGSLHANLGVELGGSYQVTSQIAVTQLDLDPLISGVLHLTALTGHSHVDGQFTLAGSLLRPETLALQADLSRILLDYEYVKLENAGPVRFQYARSEIRVEQANLRGAETDFRVTGLARFSGDRTLDMRVDGNVNLQLFGGFVPNLDARGPGVLNAAFAGTVSNPRITGRIHVDGGSVRYGDFPAGLSGIKGDFTFDTSRLVFDNVTGGIGGGQILLAGSLTYGGGPAHFDISATTSQARIRYPVGMSWLAAGNLRLTGTAQAGTLSGHVTVDRLLMAEGLDFSSVFGGESGTAGGGSTSPFLRNLELDIVADSSPTAQLQWPSGSIQTDASLRVRGTWDHPILLGSIHLLSGDMSFRGQRYRLSRGDINFVNPFQIDPVLNIEATTTIRQYEVTVNFSGAASHLSMSYRSDPPLPSSDIIALLALGQTGQESQLRGTSGAQTPQVGATALLSEAVSSQLGGRIQRLFGISHFSVDPSYVSDTAIQNPGARVTISQQFSRDFIITYSTDVTSTQQQVIQIEYTLRRNISIIALRDENGTFGIDVVRKKRFK
jgi:translocation and assembly module TamB